MAGLEAIGVRVEGPRGQLETTHNALPVLHEIRHALQRLSELGEPTVIDLSSIPFAPGDRDRLFEALGRGEVTATLDALGKTRISETAYPGVWLVQHLTTDDQVLTAQIEVTRLPTLLVTPEADLPDAVAALGAHLDQQTSVDN